MKSLELVNLAKTEVLAEIEKKQLKYLTNILKIAEHHLQIGNGINNEIKKFQNDNMTITELHNSVKTLTNTYGVKI